jgi:hypothetical protein
VNAVVWRNKALDELADIWVRTPAAGRPAIEAAVERIKRLLRDDPAAQGESRGGAWRVMFEPPLGVTFHVDDAAGVVTVARVRLLRSRP